MDETDAEDPYDDVDNEDNDEIEDGDEDAVNFTNLGESDDEHEVSFNGKIDVVPEQPASDDADTVSACQIASEIDSAPIPRSEPHSIRGPPHLDSTTTPPNNHSREGLSCCLLYTSPSPRDQRGSRMPSSA